MAKKSKAQLRRLETRAAARGEEYATALLDLTSRTQAPLPVPVRAKPLVPIVSDNAPYPALKALPKKEDDNLAAAKELRSRLEEIERNTILKSKERRSAKRKAEALALETTGLQAEELLQWLRNQEIAQLDEAVPNSREKNKSKKPYVLFIGQLAFESTKERLFSHIQSHLESECKLTQGDVKIRVLTDPETNKSRGMAFIELMDPEMLYRCLKLHHSYLDGRRINVERSAGGSKNSEQRKRKLKTLRDEQTEHIGQVVETIIGEYKNIGEIRDDELDEGVIGLCKRHSASVVQAAVDNYVETGGRDKDNPSAYLSYLLDKLAKEGVFHDDHQSTRRGGPRRA